MKITQFTIMTESEIVAEAQKRGYTVHDAPSHYANPGKRIGGSKLTAGADEWMNAANNALYEIQTRRKL